MFKSAPALFVAHGNPMNAIEDNHYSRAWRLWGATLERPTAILVISAHWYEPRLAVSSSPQPSLMYDFWGFPEELYKLTYPAKGSPSLAKRVEQLLSPFNANADPKRGLDHGAWTVLYHLFPKADVPVVQLSIDSRKPASFHYEVGKKLGILRDENVLMIGSGNIVHNLGLYLWQNPTGIVFDWATRFETKVKEAMKERNVETLINDNFWDNDARLAAPTPDHFLPLLTILGASRPTDTLQFPVEGMEGGSLSMLSVQLR